MRPFHGRPVVAVINIVIIDIVAVVVVYCYCCCCHCCCCNFALFSVIKIIMLIACQQNPTIVGIC